jgi:TP901 family phage tail tape measure protein
LIALASTAVIAVAKTANELEKLYYSSKRIGASAENIRAYGDAISQMGGSAEGAISSLESVARKLRESPGYEGMLKGLGVNTRDQNGQMRDRVEVMKDLSKHYKAWSITKLTLMQVLWVLMRPHCKRCVMVNLLLKWRNTKNYAKIWA